MSYWFNKIAASDNLFEHLSDSIEFFKLELKNSKKEVMLSNKLEKNITSFPVIFENRYRQLKEIEAILEFLKLKFKEYKNNAFKTYKEKYNRSLSSKEAENYSNGSKEAIVLSYFIKKFIFLKNQFFILNKSLENKSKKISNIVKLKTAGVEDINIESIHFSMENIFDSLEFEKTFDF